MMNRNENILVTAAEECAEIQQAISKALRFGLTNHHPDIPDSTNAGNILIEYYQLTAVIKYLQQRRTLPIFSTDKISQIMDDKIINVKKWQEVSYSAKTLEE